MGGHGHVLLIIEDNEAIRRVLARLMDREGWEVRVAGSVTEGVAQLDSEPAPDCLLLDLDLPDGRGEVILSSIRERHLPVRVAVCSAMADPDRWEAVGKLHPEAVLHKPVDLGTIRQACEVP